MSGRVLPDPRNKLNDLTGKEWLQLSRSWWFQKGLGRKHPETAIELQHPAPFSFHDVQKLVRLLTKPGMTVLDPFSGVGSTVKAAALSGRNAIGIDVSTRWVKLGKRRVIREVPAPVRRGLILKQVRADSRSYLRKLKPNSIDLIVTSPPYWTILNKDPDHKVAKDRVRLGLATRYSRSRRDIGNTTSYRRFLSQLTQVLRGCRRVLKPGSYAVLIVGDFRHASRFYPFHLDVIHRAQHAGFELKGILLLVQNGKGLYPYGYPFTLVQNIHHQYGLILVRPQSPAARGRKARTVPKPRTRVG